MPSSDVPHAVSHFGCCIRLDWLCVRLCWTILGHCSTALLCCDLILIMRILSDGWEVTSYTNRHRVPQNGIPSWHHFLVDLSQRIIQRLSILLLFVSKQKAFLYGSISNYAKARQVRALSGHDAAQSLYSVIVNDTTK
jgi:hypothetical protein